MGDRANVQFHDGGDDSADMFFYTHWDGYKLPLTLQEALKRGRDRWGDGPYLARIIFCQMVTGNEMESRGYGLSTYLCDNEYPILHVDSKAQTVWLGGNGGRMPFADYIELELDKEEPWQTLKSTSKLS